MDTIIVGIVVVILILAAKGFGALVGIILYAVYYTMMLSRGGQTLGNRSVGTVVVDSRTGGPLSTGKALGRWASQAVLGWIPFGGLLDVLFPLWDREKQTLHDKMAGTVVLQT